MKAPTFFTIKDTAKMLGCTTRTIAKYLTRGLPHYKFEGAIRISPSDLFQWIQDHKRQSSPSIPVPREERLGKTLMEVFAAGKCPKPRGIFSPSSGKSKGKDTSLYG
jgi:hypothetical protein